MFRFTIRDLLWLTVVVAVALGLGLGWWRDRVATDRQHQLDLLIHNRATDACNARYSQLVRKCNAAGVLPD
jgi:hypothetical protein